MCFKDSCLKTHLIFLVEKLNIDITIDSTFTSTTLNASDNLGYRKGFTDIHYYKARHCGGYLLGVTLASHRVILWLRTAKH